MAEVAAAAAINSERAEGPEPDSDAALFHRRIEFHVARKPFTGFGNNSANGFKLVTLNPNPEPHKASGSGKKPERSSELSETRLDPELSFEITFRKIGAGLRNLGNTCYLNSVLQCLTYTEPLAAYLQSGKHQNSCRTSGFCALCAIQKHVSRALQSSGRILEPKDLVSNLRCISRSFRNARQEDAHEYMVNLLESMHKCCLPSGVPSESPGAYEKSLVHKIFGGRLRSQVKCMQCSYCSNTYDPFLDLSLEIVRADSLLKALTHFTAKEQLDGGGKHYQCQQCKQKVNALKQLTVHKAPHVLTVHLKRFSSHSPGRKIDKKIAFGPTLDLKPFVTGPYEGGLNYTLYGVLVHAGWNTHSGHYYCFVRTSSGMWYTLDDNNVYQVNERKVLEQKAYMLFYVRDRKNFIMKKPVDVIRKENMVMKATGNVAYSKPNLEMKDKIQNGTIEKNIDDSSFGASSAQKIPFQNGNETISVDNNSHKRGPHSEYASLVPLSKAPLMDLSTMNINSVDHKRNLDLTDGAPIDTLNLNDAPRIVAGNNRLSVVERLCKMDKTSSETCGKKIEPMDTVAEASNKVNNLKSSQQNSIEENQVGGSSKEIVDSTIEGNHENRQLLKATAKHSSCGELKKKKPQLKVKRKVLKYHIPSMSLSSKIIYDVGLNMRKKNLKRRKDKKKSHPTARDDLQTDLGPSSTDKLLPQKKKPECSSDGKSQDLSDKNIRVSSDVINNELTKRVVNATTHSLEKLPQKIQSEAQTDVMSLLTRGLEETTVARWDGIEVTHSEKFATRAAETTAQIGYIGDEWDEEYDRGKRKKIRGPKISFDGPNPFQEIATQNSKRKRAKLNRAENQPFRIL